MERASLIPRILLFRQTADILKYPQRQKAIQKRTMHTFISCVASVSVRFRSKVRPRNGSFGFGRAKNETRVIFWAVSPRNRTETAYLGKTEAPEEERRTTGDEPQWTMGRVARCLFPPCFARTFSWGERRPGLRQARKCLRRRLSHLLQALEDPRFTPSNWLLSSQLGNESFRSFIGPINSQGHY